MDASLCPIFSPTVSSREVLYDGIVLGSKRERKSPDHFGNGQVSEEIFENPPPAQCPSNVLMVPESPNTDFICPVAAELYHVLLLTL